ncbi:MAG TPA: nitrate- and nitrite sensing domain-containing protein [Streptosporangiaceae bacterium]|nr:nitrate- and nitrite sensing domain-containing protein [Streptosporangiaceae bacterium]
MRSAKRKLLLIGISALTATALILGGIRIVQSVQSANALQRSRSVQLATLSSNVTTLVQRLRDESGQTVYFIVHGRNCLLYCVAHADQAVRELGVVVAQQASTNRTSRVVDGELAHIGPSFPTRIRQEAESARFELSVVLPELRDSASATSLPALVAEQEYTKVIDRLLALEHASA